ncbi:MAG: Thivi_2564 family membrane protein [Bryobacteraceae bacterium]
MQWIYVLVALIVVVLIGWFMNRNNLVVPNNGRTLLNIVLALIVVGIGLWLINTYVPMAGSIKAILNIVVVVATCVGVLQAFGLWGQVVRLWDNMVKGARRSTLTAPVPTPDTPHSTKT